MTYKQALKIYLKHRTIDKEIIRRIMHWDSSKSIIENARYLKITKGNSYNCAIFYKLKFYRIGSGGDRKSGRYLRRS